MMKPKNYIVTKEQMARVLKGETVCLLSGKEGVSIRMNADGSFQYIANAQVEGLNMGDHHVGLKIKDNKVTHVCEHSGVEFDVKCEHCGCYDDLKSKYEKLLAMLKRMDECGVNCSKCIKQVRELLKELQDE